VALSRDTSPEAERVQVELLRVMSVGQKLEMVAGLNALVRSAAISGLNERYPEADEEEIQWRLTRIVLGEVLADRVFAARRTRRSRP
jgi:hypothetical protein